MKKILILAVALTIIISSCVQKKEINSQVIIAGHLKNYEASGIRIFGSSISQDVNFKEGDFKINFEAEASKIYRIVIMPGEIVSRDDSEKEKYIAHMLRRKERSVFEFFLSPGDSIYFTADFLEPNASFKVAGNHAEVNTYLFEKRIPLLEFVRNKLLDYQRNEFVISGGTWTPLMGLVRDQYFYTKDSLFNVLRNKFEALKASKTLDSEFIKLEEAYFQYEPLLIDLDYPHYHSLIHNIHKDSVDFPVSQIRADLDKMDMTRSELLSSNQYIALIRLRIRKATNYILNQDSLLKNNPDGYDRARMMAIDELLNNQLIKDHFLYEQIKYMLDLNGPVQVKADYDQFMQEHQSPKLAAQLKESYEKWDTILPGMHVPDFSFEDIEGNSVKLSDLRGKLVYIDIWATWCKPCIEEHPYWNKLREEYKDKEVSFLSISVDFNKQAWEKMVKAKNMEGLQWYTEHEMESELARHFMVSYIPRFLLLDQEGKIIDPLADKPSGNIKALLDQHL
jgi:thiol-disulfide isomerase/thioredoxin